MLKLRTMLNRFYRDIRGVALIEFVFVAPFLLLLTLGGAELTRYILISQKVDKSVYALADVVAQSAPSGAGSLNEAGMTTTLNMFNSMMSPFDRADRQAAIVTSVMRCGTNNRILWQYAGGGTLSGAGVTSVVNGRSPGAVGPSAQNTNATFPANIAGLLNTMQADENMIVMEVFYSYRPFLSDVLDGLFEFTVEPAIITRRAYLYPRNGTLNCLLPGNPCTACATVTPPITPPTGPGGICPAGDCAPGSLSGVQPCDCVENGQTARGWTGGPFGCGRYRCTNGIWQLITPMLCTTAPMCS